MIEITVVFNESQIVKQNQFSISFQFASPSCPFYGVVEKETNTILYRFDWAWKAHSSLNYILKNLEEELQRKVLQNLNAVCNFINSNKRLLDTFKIDFITRTLKTFSLKREAAKLFANIHHDSSYFYWSSTNNNGRVRARRNVDIFLANWSWIVSLR